jgi:manganese/iron transport system substrate-binding protein
MTPVAVGQEKLLTVIASTTQIADFTREILGPQGRVSSILAPGADPHTYSPTPGDMQRVLAADICFQNGLYLEGKNWMQTLARDAKKPIFTLTEGIEPLKINERGTAINDPHAWFAPRNAAVYVNNIVRVLSSAAPQHKALFEARGKLYLQQLRVLDGWIREVFSALPPGQRLLVTSHDAFNYFCREYGFNEKFGYLSLAPVGWSTGAELGAGMTPQRRDQVVQSIRNFGAKAIFVETSVNPKIIREIARDAGVGVGGSLYSDSMGEKGTAAETYVGMMRENVLTILLALKDGKL